jgi:glyoxylase-like metal-dependent hydrolase (beta-lactamase superfamily II)
MKRAIVLAAVPALGGLCLAVSALAQAPPGPSAAALSALKIEKVKDTLYVITGSGPGDAFSGGNTAVFITSTGVTLVYTKLPGFGQAMLDRIKTVTDKPVTRIINTHAHGDHTGNNQFFGASVEAIIHENADAALQKSNNRAQRRTYRDRLSLGSGKDAIELYHFGRGHTDGDTFVVFTGVRAMHAGDLFPWKALPYIDAGIGGSAVQHPKTLARAVDSIRNVDTVIPGHAPVATWNEFTEYADFTQDFVSYAERAMKMGKSVDEAAAQYTVPAKNKGYVATAAPNLSVRASMQLAYDELRRK